MRRSFALVFNARAGVARPKLLDGVLSHLKVSGADVFQVAARSADEAAARVAELAAQGGADAVIAAGGDGTFRAVAIGAAGTDLPIGFIPLGTGNVLAYEIGIRKRAVEIATGLLTNPTIHVRGGLVNDVPFFLMVGAGYDARIVHGLNYKTKRLLARAAYTAPVLKTLMHGAEVFDVDVDGEAYEASWVVMTRASHYGGSFVLTLDTQLGSDRMIAVLITASTRTGLLAASTALALGRIADAKKRLASIVVLPAKRVRIGRQLNVPVQIDGDDGGHTPIDVVADGPSVHVIVPPAYVADLNERHTNHLS